jgi:glyoxylate/hydroxypyruvate/2-ketogluconate reductase
MKSKIYIAKKVPNEVVEYLTPFCDLKMWDSEELVPRSVLLDEVADCEGVMLINHAIDEELLDRAPKLKVVSNVSVGYNNFKLPLMKKRNILGTHTPGVLDETVADLVFGLILTTARRISELDQYVKRGDWTDKITEELFGIDVHHSSIGIIGMGRIGEAIARRAKYGFNMRVMYHNRTPNLNLDKHIEAEYCSLETLLSESDFVVLMTPLTEETRGLMGKEQFNLMKESAIFINASRGETVDESALVEALQEGKIRGAGLDVFQEEPVNPNHPLLKFPHVVTIPHLGSATVKTRGDMAMLAAQNLVAALEGRMPPSLVKELME